MSRYECGCRMDKETGVFNPCYKHEAEWTCKCGQTMSREGFCPDCSDDTLNGGESDYDPEENAWRYAEADAFRAAYGRGRR